MQLFIQYFSECIHSWSECNATQWLHAPVGWSLPLWSNYLWSDRQSLMEWVLQKPFVRMKKWFITQRGNGRLIILYLWVCYHKNCDISAFFWSFGLCLLSCWRHASSSSSFSSATNLADDGSVSFSIESQLDNGSLFCEEGGDSSNRIVARSWLFVLSFTTGDESFRIDCRFWFDALFILSWHIIGTEEGDRIAVFPNVVILFDETEAIRERFLTVHIVFVMG